MATLVFKRVVSAEVDYVSAHGNADLAAVGRWSRCCYGRQASIDNPAGSVKRCSTPARTGHRARQLGSTPSTVSRQIKRLEEALGTRLLERSTRSVRVTDSGAQVYRYCRDMVGAASGAVDVAGHFLPSKVRALIDYLASHLHDAVDE
jgi:DNA-binding transcriptional ArsR family regulator